MLSLSASIALTRASAAQRLASPSIRRLATTYSGGQPYEGQGGFYGAIKSRSEKNASFKKGLRAEPSDLEQLQRLMATVNGAADPDAAWTDAMATAATTQLLQRLVVKGAPAWGLSVDQRAFVARFLAKIN